MEEIGQGGVALELKSSLQSFLPSLLPAYLSCAVRYLLHHSNKRYYNTADLISEASLSYTGLLSCYSTIVFSGEILFP